mmetsp:Transcript_10886/g.23926  ORF Transcript_10886/g.23926 Transcript_10886/m.23926 type:complete len:132 (+) Transcript_10886:197-592(+)
MLAAAILERSLVQSTPRTWLMIGVQSLLGAGVTPAGLVDGGNEVPTALPQGLSTAFAISSTCHNASGSGGVEDDGSGAGGRDGEGCEGARHAAPEVPLGHQNRFGVPMALALGMPRGASFASRPPECWRPA